MDPQSIFSVIHMVGKSKKSRKSVPIVEKEAPRLGKRKSLIGMTIPIHGKIQVHIIQNTDLSEKINNLVSLSKAHLIEQTHPRRSFLIEEKASNGTTNAFTNMVNQLPDRFELVSHTPTEQEDYLKLGEHALAMMTNSELDNTGVKMEVHKVLRKTVDVLDWASGII